jgi:hypothetical protein
MKLEGKHLAGGIFVAAAALLLLGAFRKSGGAAVPASPYTEGLSGVADLAMPHLIRPELTQMGSTGIYTQHRYPNVLGGELSTIIHYGHSRLAIPNTRDSNWITCPPSEVTL